MKAITLINSHVKQPDGVSPAAHREYLERGLTKLGVEVVAPGAYSVSTKHVACWGWRVGLPLWNAGHEVLVMERGYIGDRYKYTSLGWNGLNNWAEFPEYEDDGGERFRAHGGIIHPWKTSGQYAVILGQVRGDASLKGKNIDKWYRETAQQIEQYYDIPVYFRPHPLAKRRGGYHGIAGLKNIEGTLEEVLEGALFTAAYNSNACLDSVLAGVPCLAGDKGTMAYPLCMKDVRKIVHPDREKFVHAITWRQWERAEIESGQALEKIITRIY